MRPCVAVLRKNMVSEMHSKLVLFATLGADVCPDVAVSQLMSFASPRLCKAFATGAARVRTFTSMYSHVVIQCTRHFKDHVAYVTHDGFLIRAMLFNVPL